MKNLTEKNSENDLIETLRVEFDTKKYGKFCVRSRQLGVNKTLNYDKISELINRIEEVSESLSEPEKIMSLELVTVATSYNVVEAEFLRNQLEAEGYEVYLEDENIIGVFNLLAPAVGGIKIRVNSDKAEAAAALVNDLRNAEIIYDENFPET